jgi:hypothetical protein
MKDTHPAFRGALPILAMLALAGWSPLASQPAPHVTAFASTAPTRINQADRPLRGRCEGSGIFRAGLTILDVTGTCHLSQLGLTTTAGVETVTPVAGGFLSSGVYTYRTADGDILNTTGSGLATLNSDLRGMTFSFNEIVVSGTGRFANASGSATRIGSSRFSDGKGSWEISGMLTYAALDRK